MYYARSGPAPQDVVGTVLALGLGVYKMTDEIEANFAIQSALKIGYRLIDTASLYENEQVVGAAVKESDVSREEIFITSKVWNSDQGYDHTLRAFEEDKEESSW